jgi:hypothetical protein
MVPEVDFMVICDYVRADRGVLHMIAAGIDRIQAPAVPTAQNVGVGIRLILTPSECGEPHHLQLVFQTEDGGRLLELNAQFEAEYPPGLAPGELAGAVFPANVGLALPGYGRYSLDLWVDDVHKKSVPLAVVQPPAPQA